MFCLQLPLLLVLPVTVNHPPTFIYPLPVSPYKTNRNLRDDKII